MAARDCPITLSGCPGVDAPITNISAEAPDELLFASIVWDPYRPYRPPPLGNGEYNDTDCNSVFGPLWAIYDPVVYGETQAMANLMALATQLGCAIPERPPEDPDLPTQVYINDAQTQTVYCPDGSAFSYTVEAGTLTSPPYNAILGPIWVEIANAWAAAYALEQASAMMDCVTRPEQPPEDTPGGPDIPPPGGGGGSPLFDYRFYWCCLGETLVDSVNTYTFGGRANAEYTITVTDGAIPPGTTFSQIGPRTCLLSGTPTAAGAYAWKIHAVSTTAPTLTIDVWDNLFVFGLTSGPLPDGHGGQAYGPLQLTAAGGNGPNYTFSSGDLPSGFNLTSDGILSSDTSIVDGDYTFTVTVTDELGAYCDQELSLSVVPDTDCEGVPSVIGDLTWAVTTTPTSPIDHASGSMAGGNGVGMIQLDHSGFPIDREMSVIYTSYFCNPTAIPVTLTVTVTNVYSGTVYTGGGIVNKFTVVIWKDGIAQDSMQADVVTELPNPVSASMTISPYTTNQIRISIVLQCAPAIPFVKADSTIVLS